MSLRDKLVRLAWEIMYRLLIAWNPRGVMNRWRSFVLRCFGAKIGRGCKIDPGCRIWAPWNLEMEDYAAMANGVDCYCVGRISIGTKVVVSQRAFLCSASHDISTLRRDLVIQPIAISAHAWVCAEAYIGPGVTIGEGAVVGARAAVFRSVEPWHVVGGNPARTLKVRCLIKDDRKSIGV